VRDRMIAFFWMLVLCPFMIYSVSDNDIQSKKTELNNTSRISPDPLLEVADGLLKSLRAKNIDRAYTDYTSKDFRKKTSLDNFKALIAKYNVLSSNKLFQFQSFFVEDNIASLGGDLHSEEGITMPVEFDFVLEDGKWKIMGIQIYRNELSFPLQEDFTK
jgi:hypothetical protein